MRGSVVAHFAPLALLAATPSSMAGTIVQNIPGLVQNLGDFTPFDINALPFNPATGVLTDVTIEIIGNYTPETATDATLVAFPATATLTSRVFVFATNGGPTTNVPLGSQTLPVVVASPGAAGISTGPSTAFDMTFPLSDLAAFETGIAGSQLLVEYGFKTATSLSGPDFPSGSDLTSFSGSAVLTYDFAVSEPASLALLGTALAGFGLVRRRKRKAA
jgi:hypothetical protein